MKSFSTTNGLFFKSTKLELESNLFTNNPRKIKVALVIEFPNFVIRLGHFTRI